MNALISSMLHFYYQQKQVFFKHIYQHIMLFYTFVKILYFKEVFYEKNSRSNCCSSLSFSIF